MADPTTYEALFADPSLNPSGDDPVAGYQEIYHRWRVDDNPPTAADVHRDVLTDFDATIGAVGYFVRDSHSGSGILKVAHGFRRFAGQPGRPNQNRGKSFAYVGDVVDGLDVATFEVDESQFEIVTETRCANTPERHAELFIAEPDKDLIAPIDSTSQAQSMIKTRRSMFIPFELVSYLIDKDYSAREAFEVIWPIVVAENLRDVVKPLIKFLMVAATQYSTTRHAPRTVNDSLGHGVVGDPQVLSDRRQRVLYVHLPSLKPTAPSSQATPQFTAIVAELSQLNDHARRERADKQAARDEADKPKTVRERFGDYVVDKLLRLCDVQDDDDLPKIYHELAGRTKGVNKRLLLKQCYDIVANRWNLNKLPATSSHVIDLENYEFIGNQPENLGGGLLLFSVVPPDAPTSKGRKAIAEESERSRLYDMSGDAISGAISSADAKKLYTAKGYIPTTWTEVDIQLESYQIVLGTILGTTHNLVRHYRSSLEMYDRIKVRLHAAMDKKYGQQLAPALLGLYFHLGVRSWLEETWEFELSHVELPGFTTDLRSYSRSKRFDWLPDYSDLPQLKALETGRSGQAPEATGSRSSTPRTAGDSNSPAGGNNPITNRVLNPHRDPRYVGNTPLAVNIRTRSIRNAISVAGRDPPQVSRNNRTMPTCLSWHVKGSCSEECNRKADHVQSTEEEAEALYQWCVPAFA